MPSERELIEAKAMTLTILYAVAARRTCTSVIIFQEFSFMIINFLQRILFDVNIDS